MTTRLAALSTRVLASLGLAEATAVVPAAVAAAEGDHNDEQAPAEQAPVSEAAPADEPADDAAVAAAMTDTATAAAAAATKAANARWGAVLASDEAKGRMSLATHLLGTTAQSVDDIKATLTAAPQSAASSAFASQMATINNPAVSADGAQVDNLDPRAASAALWATATASLPGAKN